METENTINLRLRFYKDIDETVDVVRQKFIDYKSQISSDYVMKIRRNHIQFTIGGLKQRYWSPYLTIELEEKEGSNGQATHIRGLFGPAQTMWTFFIFMHFMVAGIFIVFMMFALSDYMLRKSITSDFIVMGLMVFCWIFLYILGRQTRENGYGQMNELEQEFLKIIK
ncbi:hypothetical protein V8245_00585 [Flavobacterium columnare]|uniref:GTP-binding protein n=1 Tax=Flavobacterium columnare (strain ATCC 49512 / CIP 103533 / TG 44/87) TaxID=1041826 RepID=G8X6A7_FLACA|nr:hypothetical protein [Flavobacterium columnare]AEW86948.1 hypothetical protein FCOL_10725 [Flavobacterium columnare ATCC 49512]